MPRKTKRKRVNWLEKYTASFWIDGDIVAGMVGEKASVPTWVVDQLFEDLQAKNIKIQTSNNSIISRRRLNDRKQS